MLRFAQCRGEDSTDGFDREYLEMLGFVLQSKACQSAPADEKSFMHGPFVKVSRFFDDTFKVDHDVIAVGQDFIKGMIFWDVVFIEVILPRPLDYLIVDVGDVHDVEDVVTKVVLKHSKRAQLSVIGVKLKME